jgi:hypothetical protein
MNDTEIAVSDEQESDDAGPGFCPYCGQPVLAADQFPHTVE